MEGSMGFLIQSNHGTVGNFEVVVPRVGGGMDHWWRSNDAPAAPWKGPTIVFGSANDLGGVTLIQSSFGPVGNLEVVVREGGQLAHCWRDDGGTFRGKQRTALPGP